MNLKALLVDDEPHILRAAEFKLRRHGFDVASASDGEEAWERIQVERPDVVITDCQMPRLNGLELVQRLRAHPAYAALPVVMLTARGFDLNRDEAVQRLGVFEIVAKPFSPRDLCRCVQAAVEQSGRSLLLSS